jgi:hypothetical protein
VKEVELELEHELELDSNHRLLVIAGVARGGFALQAG